jgi:hypothetical protein
MESLWVGRKESVNLWHGAKVLLVLALFCNQKKTRLNHSELQLSPFFFFAAGAQGRVIHVPFDELF